MKTITVRELRERLGLTQVEMGKKLKVKQGTISSWECNRAIPEIYYRKKLLELAKEFNCSVKFIKLSYGDTL